MMDYFGPPPTSGSPVVLPFMHSHHPRRSTTVLKSLPPYFCQLLLSSAFTITSQDFSPRTIFIQWSLLSSRYHHVQLNTTANPTLILRSSYERMSRGKVIRASLHLFFTCSSKVVLRLQTLLSNNYRHVSETTILTLCKKFMIGSLPFSSFF